MLNSIKSNKTIPLVSTPIDEPTIFDPLKDVNEYIKILHSPEIEQKHPSLIKNEKKFISSSLAEMAKNPEKYLESLHDKYLHQSNQQEHILFYLKNVTNINIYTPKRSPMAKSDFLLNLKQLEPAQQQEVLDHLKSHSHDNSRLFLYIAYIYEHLQDKDQYLEAIFSGLKARNCDVINYLASSLTSGEWLNKNQNLARKVLNLGYRLGNKESAEQIAKLYLNGIDGAKPNFTMAIKWFNLAINLGSVPARHSLAELYMNGYNQVAPNEAEAIKTFKDLAALNYIPSLNVLANYYRTKHKDQEAFQLFNQILNIKKNKLELESEFIPYWQDALTKLIPMYELGVGTEQNLNKAHKLREKLADSKQEKIFI